MVDIEKVSALEYQKWPEAKVVFVRAAVERSMRINEAAHRAWVLLEDSGVVRYGHCTCAAGLGEICSHVAAILFKLQIVTSKKEVSPTDSKCQWNQARKRLKDKACLSKPLHDIDVTKHKLGSPKKKKLQYNAEKSLATARKDSPRKAALFYDLRNNAISSQSVILHLKYAPAVDEEAVSIDTPRPSVPLAFHKFLQSQGVNIIKEVIKNWLNLYNTAAIDSIKESSIQQRDSNVWQEQRVGRIGSSQVGECCLYPHRNSLPRKIATPAISVQNTDKLPSPLAWGIKNESIAFDSFIKSEKEKHQNFVCNKSGLHICKEYTFLSSSPDGIVSCTCCGNGVLEIKCPFSIRNVHPLQGSTLYKGKYILNENGEINEEHLFYYQVQSQMAILDIDYCDFCVYTSVDLHITRVRRDKEFWELALKKLIHFYDNIFIPFVVKQYQN